MSDTPPIPTAESEMPDIRSLERWSEQDLDLLHALADESRRAEFMRLMIEQYSAKHRRLPSINELRDHLSYFRNGELRRLVSRATCARALKRWRKAGAGVSGDTAGDHKA